MKMHDLRVLSYCPVIYVPNYVTHLSQSKFNVEKMVITELQEQQTNQRHITTDCIPV